MIRIIVRTDDAGMAANVGGDVLAKFRTFDLHLPELEAHINAVKGNSYAHAQIIGAEIIPDPPEAA